MPELHGPGGQDACQHVLPERIAVRQNVTVWLPDLYAIRSRHPIYFLSRTNETFALTRKFLTLSFSTVAWNSLT